jgi:hypothetical protein
MTNYVGGYGLACLGLGILLSSCSQYSAGPTSNQSSEKLIHQISTLNRLAEKEVNPESYQMLKVKATWNAGTEDLRIITTEVGQVNFFPNLSAKSKPPIEGPKRYGIDCCCDSRGDLIWTSTCRSNKSCAAKIYSCLSQEENPGVYIIYLLIIPPSNTTNGLIRIVKT